MAHVTGAAAADTQASMAAAAEDASIPLCVDLDGTLIRSDTLLEGMVRLLHRNPASVFLMAYWLFRGRARLKAEIAARITLEAELLPVHEPFVAWLREQAQRGRRLILCTAASQRVAEPLAAHFDMFDSVLASGAQLNLQGEAKAARLVAMFGAQGFDYAGNDVADLHPWQSARRVIVVAPTRRLQRRLAEVPRVERIFAVERPALRTWVRALRLHQWIKNVLICLPAAAAHRLLQPQIMIESVLAFVIFGICASGTYLLNDLMDLDSDRRHPSLKERPFAAGSVSLGTGLIVAALMVGFGLAAAGAVLGWQFLASLTFYVVITVWYSRALKRIPMVDTLALAGLYSVRVVAGAAATLIVPSFWLLAFTMFLFLSLAMAKRYSELKLMTVSGRTRASGRGYTVEDAPLLQSCGVAAGYMSVLVLALYINSTGAQFMYSRSEFLWLLCPLLLYWTTRVWIKTSRGQMHDDPVVFTLSDRPSLTVALIGVALVWAAS